MKYILIFLFIGSLSAQNRPPIANDDSAVNAPLNCLINDLDPDGDVLRILDYSINGVKYSTRNSPRLTAMGMVTFTANGDVSADSIGEIIYRISDGNRGVDTAVIKFQKPKTIDSSFFISGVFNTSFVMIAKYDTCIEVDTGRYYALLAAGNSYMYGYLVDTSVNIDEKYRFMIRGSIMYYGYPYGVYSVKQKFNWAAFLPRKVYLMIRENGCKK